MLVLSLSLYLSTAREDESLFLKQGSPHDPGFISGKP